MTHDFKIGEHVVIEGAINEVVNGHSAEIMHLGLNDPDDICVKFLNGGYVTVTCDDGLKHLIYGCIAKPAYLKRIN